MRGIMKSLLLTGTLVATLCGVSDMAVADSWSTNEVHYQVGSLLNPFTDQKHTTNIFTLQHASGWKYGDNFFFIDYIDDVKGDGFNDTDVYGELYLNFSLGKITGYDFSWGALNDVGLVAGLNASKDANSRKYLPGVKLSWDVPGFKYFNTLITAYIDDSDSQQTDSYMFDVSWDYPFEIGDQSFSVGGHAEYIGSRDNSPDNGIDVEAHILAQPQFRWDVGKAILGTENKVFAGIEYQYWNNKLGTKNDESAVQGLLVLRF